MKLAAGDMWSAWSSVDLFLITTNSTVRRDGALVMGRGIAKEAATRWPRLPYSLGNRISSLGTDKYGIIVSAFWPKTKIGAFQVKVYWGDPADLDLILFSTKKLIHWCGLHPSAAVALNFPGIGNGRQDPANVLPIIRKLPDQVTVWTRHPLGGL